MKRMATKSVWHAAGAPAGTSSWGGMAGLLRAMPGRWIDEDNLADATGRGRNFSTMPEEIVDPPR